MDDAALREQTKKTSKMLFHTLKGGAGYDLWKRFDRELARELSMFFAGKLYSREVGEVIMQQVTYGGMPVVVEALKTYAEVLEERGEPFPAEG